MLNMHDARQNRLLASLPNEEFTRLIPYLEPTAMPAGRVLYESGGLVRHLYFPTSSIVSLQQMSEDGVSSEISTVGNEGMIGIALCLGGESLAGRAVILCAGDGYRLQGRLLKDEIARVGPMPCLLRRCTQALLAQTVLAAPERSHRVLDRELFDLIAV